MKIKSRTFHRLLLLMVCTAMGGFAYSQIGSISGQVSDKFEPLAGAKVELVNEGIKTICDAEGKYRFDLEPGRYLIKATYLMYESAQIEVVISFGNIHPELNFILSPGSAADEKVEIGTRFEPQTQLESPVSIDIVTQEDIISSGQLTLSQVLMYRIPSFNANRQTISDGTDHVTPSTIRGLGPDQFLVLINGKRRHASSLVNVNGTIGRGSVSTDLDAIPLAAIDRVEVMRDGAGAQYGSDAIAGVINVILKENPNVFSLVTAYQPTLAGDGTEDYFGASYGIGSGLKGFVNIATEIRRREAVNRAGDYLGNVYSDTDYVDQQLIAENRFFEQTGYENHQIMQIGAAGAFDGAVMINAEFPLENNSSVYTNGGMNYRQGRSRAFYRLPKDEQVVVRELFPNGFSPELNTDILDRSGTIGVRGKKRGWLIDLSNTTGQNRIEYTVRNTNNASMGIASPTDFYAGGFVYGLNTTNLGVSRTINGLSWIESLGIAFGSEFRAENYSINAGEEASWIDGGETLPNGDPRAAGSQGFNGFQPENKLNKRRSGGSVYGDVHWVFLKNFLVETAIRGETYSDFGDNLSWKLGTRYKWKEKWSVRGVYSTSFRAPSLHQVHFNNVSTQFVNGDAYLIGTFNNESAVSKAFGIGRLKAETSTNYSVGVTGKPFANVTVNIDGFYTRIEDRIVLSGQFGQGYEFTLNPIGVGAAQFMTNALNTGTAGVDATVSYNACYDKAHLVIVGAFNYAYTMILDSIRISDEFIGDSETLFNREEVGRIESGQPRTKAILSVNYGTKRWEFGLRNTYFGTVKYVHPADGDPANWVLNEYTGQLETRDQVFKPKVLTDVSASVKLTHGLTLVLGSNNVFNVYPDKHTHSANTINGSFQYSRRVQQFGVRGSVYYVRLRLNL